MNPDNKDISPPGNPEVQYDAIEKEYSKCAEMDPSKRYVQYPSALRLLGELDDQKVLDIGCGDGFFTRQLAHRGAKVTGYDNSAKQIAKAADAEKSEPAGISYEVADPKSFAKNAEYDKAVSVLVLLYAEGRNGLKDFFSSAHKHLKDGSEFVSITFNPNYKRLGEAVYNRRFSKTKDGEMKVEFLDSDKNTTFSASFFDLSSEDYEAATKEAGFSEFRWKNLQIEETGKKAMGEKFWEGYEEDCPYIGLVAKK